jgi:iron complex transport system substrate-binding protein
MTAMRRAPLHDFFRYAAVVACINVSMALAAHADTTLKDAAGRNVAVNDASRIVSVGGAVTEILYALGKDKNVVGIDTTSLYPQRAAAEKPSVGYMRQLSAEGVLGLKPSVILAIDGAGPKDTLGVLQSAGVPLVVVPDVFTGNGIVEKIRTIALATGAKERGECVVERVRADLATLDRLEAGIKKPKRVLFVLSFVNGKAMVSGSNTAADGMIRMAGAENAITAYEGYKQISDEAVIAARPDVVMTMERGGPGTVTSDAVFAHPAFAVTPAAANRTFLSMEGLYMLGFGPRSAQAARDLAISLYPELKAASPDRATAPATTCTE